MTNKKKLTYVAYNTNVLQVFFATLAFIEKNNNQRIFLYDEKNMEIINECEKHFNFDKKKKEENITEFETIKIEISHESPSTLITNYHSAALIFPRKIYLEFYKDFVNKIDKIYFRGLLTKKRMLEIYSLFWALGDKKAIIAFSINLIKNKRDFVIDTDKIHINFTKRGRQKTFKYLDENYYKEMANYKYIFCPPGDFIWTYRFFEAIQLGCIPISKHAAKDYSKFYYYKNPIKPTNNDKKEAIKSASNFSIFKDTYLL